MINTRTSKLRIITAIISICLLFEASGQNAPEESALPGHLLSEHAAVSKATDIAVIWLKYVGRPSPGAATIEEYDHVNLAVQKALKGDVTGEVSGEFIRFDVSSRTPEEAPTTGSTYIVFMQFWGNYSGKKHYRIIRFSKGDADHIAEVEKLVASVR